MSIERAVVEDGSTLIASPEFLTLVAHAHGVRLVFQVLGHSDDVGDIDGVVVDAAELWLPSLVNGEDLS